MLPPEDYEFEQILTHAMHARPEARPIEQLAQHARQRAAAPVRNSFTLPAESVFRARQLISLATSAIVFGLVLFVSYHTLRPYVATTSAATGTSPQVISQIDTTLKNVESPPNAEVVLAVSILLLVVVHYALFGDRNYARFARCLTADERG